jgi:hypothetical protein
MEIERNAVRLGRRHEWAVYAILSLVFASGAGWAWLHHFARTSGQFGETSRPLESWLQKAHGATSMLALILFGTLFVTHIQRGWQARRNRRSGGSLFILFAFLVVTGYALYYSGNETFRALASSTHLWVGLFFPAIVALHVWRGKKSRL